MNYIFKASMASFATAIVLGMSACSSSSDGTNVDPGTTDPDATTDTTEVVNSIGGKAVDGYLVYATVCLDLNNDGYCQIGDEPATSTDVNGSFSLSLTDAQRANPGFLTAPLLVYGGYDIDTNADFTGKLKAAFNEDAEVNITPLTTMVEALVAAGEDVASAEDAVASMFNLPPGTDLGADPIAAAQTDPALLVAALQLQKSLEILAEALEAAGATESQDELLEGLYGSLATQLTQATDLNLTAALGAVVAADDNLDTDALESAHEISGQIELIIGEDGVSDTAVIGTQIGAVREELVVNVIDGDGSVDGLDFTTLLAKPFSLLHAEEILRIVDFEGTDAEFDALALKVQTALKDAGMGETEFLPIQTEIAALKGHADADVRDIGARFEARVAGMESDASNVETIADYENAVAAIEGNVTALMETTEVADVNDAKNFVTQLRESVTSFVDVDAQRVEDNTSTILGSQVSLITTKIQPAVEGIASDFNASVVALGDSLRAFGDSLEPNFGAVFGTQTTIGAIEARLTAMNDAIFAAVGDNSETTNWNVTSTFGDTLAHTYSLSGTTVTETYTLNGTTVTTSWEDTEDGQLNSVTTSGAIAFSGIGYNLNISALSFDGMSVAFSATGTITGLNSSSMTLTALDLAFDIDENHMDSANMLANLEATFDGTIVSSGRTLEGSLVVSESVSSDTQMIGSYTGAAGEPSFEGTLTLDTSLDDLKTLIDDNDNWGIDPNTLLMVTYDNGTSSFVKSYTQSSNTYTLTTQDGNSLSCDVSISSDWNSYSQEVECDGGSVEAYYGDNKVISLTVNGEEHRVYGTWNSYRWNGTTDVRTPEIELKNGHIHYDNGTLYIDVDGDNAGYTEAAITSVSMRDAYQVTEMDADLSLSGSITDGTKVIRATVAIRQLGSASDLSIVAEDVAIEDGTNFIRFDSLSLIASKSLIEDGENSHRSNFESYSVEYNNDEGNDRFSEFASVILDNLALSVTDVDGDALTFDADLSYTVSPMSDYAITFNGTYSYADTVFTGYIDATGNENAQSVAYTVSGGVVANGFEPFGITIVGNFMDELAQGYALYTRGADYEIGLSLEETYDESSDVHTSTINLADSNGVMSEIVDTWGEGIDEDQDVSIILTDKDDTQLAEFGMDATGNSWEISYSDGTSETLF